MKTENSYETVVFDLDDTLYPASSGLMHAVGERMERFMQRVTGLPPAGLPELRHRFLHEHGTTLAGLQRHYHVDPEAFLADVHSIDPQQYIQPNRALQQMLTRLPQRKLVLTNGPLEHAERVLAILGIREHFEVVLDLRAFGFRPKPNPPAYAVLRQHLPEGPGRTLFVDDRVANLIPAKAMGITTVLMQEQPPAGAPPFSTNGHRPVDHVIHDILEIEAIAMHGWRVHW